MQLAQKLIIFLCVKKLIDKLLLCWKNVEILLPTPKEKVFSTMFFLILPQASLKRKVAAEVAIFIGSFLADLKDDRPHMLSGHLARSPFPTRDGELAQSMAMAEPCLPPSYVEPLISYYNGNIFCSKVQDSWSVLSCLRATFP